MPTVAIASEFLEANARIPRAQQKKVREFTEKSRAILGCLLGEDWTSPRVVEMVVTSDGHLVGRLDGDEVGYLVAKVAEIKRKR